MKQSQARFEKEKTPERASEACLEVVWCYSLPTAGTASVCVTKSVFVTKNAVYWQVDKCDETNGHKSE